MAKFKIVGTQFSKAKADGIKQGDTCVVSHEQDNQYDKMALAVHYNKERIGYVGKGSDIYDLDRNRFPLEVKVVDFLFKQDGDQYSKHELGTLVACTLEAIDLVEIKPEDNVKSFNEDVEINFNEEKHIYTHNGRTLTGATTYIKKYIVDDFKDGTVAERCSKFWNIPTKKIKDAWKLAGQLSATFGTGIHKALEFEDLYRSYKKPKDNSRCFKIKHPVIRRIVDEFFELQEELGYDKYDVIPEALVSDVENGLCGLADRILVTSWEEKTCRIQDYKVNHSFNVDGEVKFNENLPKELELTKTKLSKLSLQLKFHKQMLEKSGWTVVGFDGFIYEDKWIHYEPKMLDGFNILTGEMK